MAETRTERTFTPIDYADTSYAMQEQWALEWERAHRVATDDMDAAEASELGAALDRASDARADFYAAIARSIRLAALAEGTAPLTLRFTCPMCEATIEAREGDVTCGVAAQCSECGTPLVFSVASPEAATTAANQGWIVEYEEEEGVWLIKPTLARWTYWNKATAKLAARTLARSGYRVRIVPLLRGTPVEIEGGSDGAQE